MENLRIVFMGTPDFAVETLKAILEAKYQVVGVVTAPDKPAGRGRKMQESAVKQFALENNLQVLQPTNLKDEAFLKNLELLNPNLQVVVAFRMLPETVWKLPKYGTFNLHASLLPNYRGAAPINWALINGETKTGVTTFFIDEKIDTGEIIMQEEVAIEKDEIVGSLHDKLMEIGSKLVVKTLTIIKTGNVKTYKQNNLETKQAPKIFTETCKINWKESIDTIYNLIRGLNPYPAAWTTLFNDVEQTKVKIFDVFKEITQHNHEIGLLVVTKNEIRVAVKEGYIKIESLQLAGKKKMDAKSLLNGFQFSPTAKFI